MPSFAVVTAKWLLVISHYVHIQLHIASAPVTTKCRSTIPFPVAVVVNVQVTEARLGNDRHYVLTRCNVQHAQSIHRYTEATGDIYYLHAVAMLYYFQ